MKFEVSETIAATPAQLYRAWLEGEQHAKMTGSPATGSAEVGAKFTAWDGYISGENLELVPDQRIVQAWRTAEFAASEPDSRVELTLEAVDGGCRLCITHAELPAHGMQYQKGWVDHYFTPMKAHFRAR